VTAKPTYETKHSRRARPCDGLVSIAGGSQRAGTEQPFALGGANETAGLTAAETGIAAARKFRRGLDTGETIAKKWLNQALEWATPI